MGSPALQNITEYNERTFAANDAHMMSSPRCVRAELAQTRPFLKVKLSAGLQGLLDHMTTGGPLDAPDFLPAGSTIRLGTCTILDSSVRRVRG